MLLVSAKICKELRNYYFYPYIKKRLDKLEKIPFRWVIRETCIPGKAFTPKYRKKLYLERDAATAYMNGFLEVKYGLEWQ